MVLFSPGLAPRLAPSLTPGRERIRREFVTGPPRHRPRMPPDPMAIVKNRAFKILQDRFGTYQYISGRFGTFLWDLP